MTELYGANFPIREYILKDKDIKSHWICKGLKKSSTKKQKLYIKFLKIFEDEFKCKTYKSLFEKLRKKSKITYYSKLLHQYKTDSKRTWQVMKEISGKQETKPNLLPQETKVNKTIIQNPQDIAKEFSKFFTSVRPKLAKKIPNTDEKCQDFLTSHNEKMEFEEAFKSLKRNKAAGFDDFSRNIIIDVYDSSKNILFHVFKVSIQQGISYDSLKIGKVTPTFKFGDKGNRSNYRLISTLPVFLKVLERIMITVYNHLDSKGLLFEKRFGFQRNNSTKHAILQLTRDIADSFEKGEYTLGVFVDLTKAFDTVDHQILIKKLQYYAIDGTPFKWFKSYLSNREQYISFQDESKSCLDIICGVVQGSILRPLLFLLYVNDLIKASNTLMKLMFADNIYVFPSHKNIDAVFDSMNVELANVSTWFKSLNVDKTKWLLFDPLSKRLCLTFLLKIFISKGNIYIEREHLPKFLGAFIDEFCSGNNTSI